MMVLVLMLGASPERWTINSLLGRSPEMWAVRLAPEVVCCFVSSNLLESIISMVKVSKAPSVAVQERLKLSGVMSETLKFPISGSPAGKKGWRGWRGETNKFELIFWLCFEVEVVNRTVAG